MESQAAVRKREVKPTISCVSLTVWQSNDEWSWIITWRWQTGACEIMYANLNCVGLSNRTQGPPLSLSIMLSSPHELAIMRRFHHVQRPRWLMSQALGSPSRNMPECVALASCRLNARKLLKWVNDLRAWAVNLMSLRFYCVSCPKIESDLERREEATWVHIWEARSLTDGLVSWNSPASVVTISDFAIDRVSISYRITPISCETIPSPKMHWSITSRVECSSESEFQNVFFFRWE